MVGSHQSKAEKMSSTEVDELLNYVKMTFADILISMEFIVKQDFIGKGYHIICLTFNNLLLV